jgi:hypothetical protein
LRRGVERRILGNKTPVPATDDHKRGCEDHWATKTDLKEGEVSGLSTESEEDIGT